MSHTVKLEIFEGPLDLLLYLIGKNDLDIADIPISQITSEYLAYIELIKELNLEVAGEFLVTAATLMAIKARMLLPTQAPQEEEGPDPREELVARLLEYQKYKEAARVLSLKADSVKDIFYRGAPTFSEEDQVLELNLFELLDAFQDVLAHAQEEGIRDILLEEIPVEKRMQMILEALERRESLNFKDLFKDDTRRQEMIVTFLALLELIRLRVVSVYQREAFEDIWVRRGPQWGQEEQGPRANISPAEAPAAPSSR